MLRSLSRYKPHSPTSIEEYYPLSLELTHDDVLLGHVDEHVVELLERVVVSIAAENVRHLLFFIYLVFDMHEHTHPSSTRHHR